MADELTRESSREPCPFRWTWRDAECPNCGTPRIERWEENVAGDQVAWWVCPVCEPEEARDG